MCRDACALLTLPAMASTCGTDPTLHLGASAWRARQAAHRKVQVELGVGPRHRRARVMSTPAGAGAGFGGPLPGVDDTDAASVATVVDAGATGGPSRKSTPQLGMSVEQALFGLAHPELLHTELAGLQRAVVVAITTATAAQLLGVAAAVRDCVRQPSAAPSAESAVARMRRVGDAAAVRMRGEQALAAYVRDPARKAAMITAEACATIQRAVLHRDVKLDGSELVLLNEQVCSLPTQRTGRVGLAALTACNDVARDLWLRLRVSPRRACSR